MVGSQIRQNFHANSETAINDIITMNLQAYYAYLSARFYFSQESVALKGFEKYFTELQNQEMEYVNELTKYLHLRGGHVTFKDIPKPPHEDLEGPLKALTYALDLSKKLNQSNLDLIGVACKHGDAHLEEFVEDDLMPGRVTRIEQLGHHIVELKRSGPGLGEFLYDIKLR